MNKGPNRPSLVARRMKGIAAAEIGYPPVEFWLKASGLAV